ncbi:hypothetical protein PsYK624_056040 [Phanerochaete sordida]|uniref:Uncharacterized protein n=1 Tax=Phanerochaete sordida TaxID=48140 RepID=A0A9P3LCQ8_9APHY|nr:hypothetical protein PsYK624_056040 [Phanerochaete sordida]
MTPGPFPATVDTRTLCSGSNGPELRLLLAGRHEHASRELGRAGGYPLYGAGDEIMAVTEGTIAELHGANVSVVFTLVCHPSPRAAFDYILCGELTYLALA